MKTYKPMARTFTRKTQQQGKKRPRTPVFSNNALSDTLSITDSILLQLSIRNLSLSDSESFSESFDFSLVGVISVSDSVSVTDTFTVGPSIYTRSVSDVSVPQESIIYGATRNLSVSDVNVIAESFRHRYRTAVDLSFTVSGIPLDISESIDALTIYPYNYINPVSYGTTDYSFMSSTGFSTVCLFRLNLALTPEQRQALYDYFSYWRTDPFRIEIENDLWEGYLTTNNPDLFIRQFRHEDSSLVFEFEALKVR